MCLPMIVLFLLSPSPTAHPNGRLDWWLSRICPSFFIHYPSPLSWLLAQADPLVNEICLENVTDFKISNHDMDT